MDQMAENTPEVEIETDASEQIPDDVELAEEVETEDGSESSGNDAEEATELMTTNQNRNSTLVTKSWIRQPAKMAQSMDW